MILLERPHPNLHFLTNPHISVMTPKFGKLAFVFQLTRKHLIPQFRKPLEGTLFKTFSTKAFEFSRTVEN